MECAFGIFVEIKWSIFNTSIQLKPEAVDDVIKACVVLHNFVLSKEPQLLDEHEVPATLLNITMNTARSTLAVIQMRDHFSEYFLSRLGWVDWQDDMV